jgi:uncharacterized protein YfiM (DUF2279 family)
MFGATILHQGEKRHEARTAYVVIHWDAGMHYADHNTSSMQRARQFKLSVSIARFYV